MGRENCWKNHYTFLNVENNAGWRQYAKSVLSQNNYIDSSKLANVVHAVLSSSSWKVLFIAAFDKIYGCEYCSSRQFVAFFFNSAMHLQIFELCCPAFGIFPPYLKNWICLCTQRQVAIQLNTIMGVLLKDVAFEKSSSEMHCKVYLL